MRHIINDGANDPQVDAAISEVQTRAEASAKAHEAWVTLAGGARSLSDLPSAEQPEAMVAHQRYISALGEEIGACENLVAYLRNSAVNPPEHSGKTLYRRDDDPSSCPNDVAEDMADLSQTLSQTFRAETLARVPPGRFVQFTAGEWSVRVTNSTEGFWLGYIVAAWNMSEKREVSGYYTADGRDSKEGRVMTDDPRAQEAQEICDMVIRAMKTAEFKNEGPQGTSGIKITA